MIGPVEAAITCTHVGERCRLASDAYDRAARALDIGLRRLGGATPSEWKAEYDARIDLRQARAAYVADALKFTAVSAGYHAVARCLSAASVRQTSSLLIGKRRWP